MAYGSAQTIDDLLADSLIQKVMLADRVARDLRIQVTDDFLRRAHVRANDPKQVTVRLPGLKQLQYRDIQTFFVRVDGVRTVRPTTDVGGVADQVTARACRPMVYRSPEANSGRDGQGAKTVGHQEEGEKV